MLSLDWIMSEVAIDSGVSILNLNYKEYWISPRRRIYVTVNGTNEEVTKVCKSIEKLIFKERKLYIQREKNQIILNFNDS